MTKQHDALDLFSQLIAYNKNNPELALEQLGDIDENILKELQALLAAHHQNKQQTWFSDAIASQVNQLTTEPDLSGQQISHFTLQHKLGEGGMGTVYKAQRHDDKLQQNVAIKLINPAITALYGEKEVLREAQFLATLNHAYIAKVLDVGECDLGAYIIMEYIEGDTLLSYCQQHQLSNKARLVLFNKICDAVSYAHQNRVIHADLKPNNILITKSGDPKLVDFGIARAASMNENSNQSCYHEYIKALSHEYASPEQLNGDTITTQSDVYSLGKILKVLINKPNSEITNITNKALADLAFRYQSALQFKSDIECTLDNKPISIINSKRYVLKKYSQRYPIPFALAALLIITSIAFTSVLLEQNKELKEEQTLSESVLTFMFNTFEQGNPEVNKGQPILAKDLLLKQQEKTHHEFKNNPEIIYRLNKKIGDSLTALGEYQSANNAYQQALNVKQIENETDFWLASEIAENLIQLSEFEQAKGYLEQPLPNEPQMQARYFQLLGRIYAGLEDYKKADELYTDALSFNPDKKLESLILTDQAINLLHLSNYPKSFELRQKALKIIKKNFPEDELSIALAEHEIAIILNNMGKYPEALEYFDSSLTKSTKIYTKNHPLIAEQLANLANTYAEMKETDKAISTLKQVTETFENFYPNPHTDTGFSYVYLGNAQLDVKDYEAAKKNFDQALAINAQLSQSDSHLKLGALNGLALIYRFTEQYQKSKQAFADLLTLITDEYGIEHPRRAIVLANTIPVEVALKNNQKAKENGEEAIKIFAKQYGEDSHFIKLVQERIKNL